MLYFDKIYCICMEDRPRKKEQIFSQIKRHYPHCKPILFNAIDTRDLGSHHIGCALSHRAVINEAKNSGYKNILVFEEDAVLHKNFEPLFKKNIEELLSRRRGRFISWDILYLGACVWNPKPPKKPRTFESVRGCDYLKFLTRSTCTHALAYNNTCYDYILKNTPDNKTDMAEWCKRHAAIDQWLMYKMQGIGSVKEGGRKFKCLITEPRICSQRFLIGENKQDSPADFLPSK